MKRTIALIIANILIILCFCLELENHHEREIAALKESQSLIMGKVLAEENGTFFIATIAFHGGIGAVSFGTPDAALAFARQPFVTVSPALGKIKIEASK
jgi:hypothetical protein